MHSTPGLVRGRRPSVTLGVLAASTLAAVVLFVMTVVAARFVVFRGFELTIAFTVVGVAAGVVATRAGGSLLAAVAAVFAPNATMVLLTGPGVGDADSLVVALGTVLYVAGGVAAPGGMFAYAAGVRWRTGPWESSLQTHLRGERSPVPLVVGWTVSAVALAVAVLAVPGVVSLGMVQWGLLVGGLVVAGRCGLRSLGALAAIAACAVGAALVALAWALSVVPGSGAVLQSVGGVALFVATGALVVGLPVGLVGYAAGRAVRADGDTRS